ncbi:MAG: hypothetical protein FD126_955 [Elusimicrobia bacterium]|nr:MAG: hypothetical protein FD126_955 [Elusimicrobiota bacterium]
MSHRALLAGFIFLLPFHSRFLPLNLQAADVIFALLFLSTAVERRRWNLGFKLQDGLVVAYLSASALSVLLAPSPEGRVALAKEAYCAAIYVCFAALAAQGAALAVARWSAVAASAVCAASLGAASWYALTGGEVRLLGQAMPLPYLGQVFRLTGFFETPQMFVSYLAFSLPLTWGLAFRRGEASGAGWRAGACVTGAAAVLTFAGGFPGLAVGVLYFLWPRLGEGVWRRLRWGLCLAAACGVLVVNLMFGFAFRGVTVAHDQDRVAPAPEYPYAFQGESGASPRVTLAVTYEPMSYLLLKRTALAAWRSAPLTGIGLGRYQEATEREFQAGRLHKRHRAMRPHSTWFGRLAETGLLGGLTLAALWLSIILWGFRAIRETPTDDAWVSRALLGGLLGLLVNSPNVDAMNFRFLWVGLGLLRGLSPEGDGGPRRAGETRQPRTSANA